MDRTHSAWYFPTVPFKNVLDPSACEGGHLLCRALCRYFQLDSGLGSDFPITKHWSSFGEAIPLLIRTYVFYCCHAERRIFYMIVSEGFAPKSTGIWSYLWFSQPCSGWRTGALKHEVDTSELYCGFGTLLVMCQVVFVSNVPFGILA